MNLPHKQMIAFHMKSTKQTSEKKVYPKEMMTETQDINQREMFEVEQENLKIQEFGRLNGGDPDYLGN